MSSQPEDRFRSELGLYLQGKPPGNPNGYQNYATIGQGILSPTKVKEAYTWNWVAMACALCVARGYQPGIDGLRMLWEAQETDFNNKEPMVDDAHTVFTLDALYYQRAGLRSIGDPLAEKISAGILQMWAMRLMCSVDFGRVVRLVDSFSTLTPTVRRTLALGAVSAPAHSRSILPFFPGRLSPMDYRLQRGCGIPHLQVEKGLQQRADGDDDSDAYPFTWKMFCDHFAGDLQNDVGALVSAYRAEGYPGIASFVKYGTRAGVSCVRLRNGGYYSVIEKNVGPGPTRYISYIPHLGGALEQWPPNRLPPTPRSNGKAFLNPTTGRVHAEENRFGKKDLQFDSAGVISYYRTSPNGVQELP